MSGRRQGRLTLQAPLRMVRRLEGNSANPGPCLSEDAALAVLDGRVTPDERGVVETHVESCAQCRTLLSVLGNASPPAPAQAGRYQIERMIGAGGMGVVYAALDRQLDRRVALKVIRPDLDLLVPRLGARLIREAKLMATAPTAPRSRAGWPARAVRCSKRRVGSWALNMDWRLPKSTA